MKFYYVTNIFDLHIFDNETTALLIFFEICTEVYFVSLFFINERNITTSLLNSISKSFLNYGSLNMLFCFLDILFMFIFTRLLSKTLWKNYHFLIQILKIYFKMQRLQNVRMSNLVILKWWHFEYKTKFEKKRLLFRSKIVIFDIFFKRLCEESFGDLEINSNSKF